MSKNLLSGLLLSAFVTYGCGISFASNRTIGYHCPSSKSLPDLSKEIAAMEEVERWLEMESEERFFHEEYQPLSLHSDPCEKLSSLGSCLLENPVDSLTIPQKFGKITSDAVKACLAGRDEKDIEEVYIENGATAIDDRAFQEFTSLERAFFPQSIQSIGREAFEECKSLKELNFSFPFNLHTIFYRAFSGCTSLVHVHFPESLRRIGTEAFSGCTALQWIDVGYESPTDLSTQNSQAEFCIDGRTFEGCTNIQ